MHCVNGECPHNTYESNNHGCNRWLEKLRQLCGFIPDPASAWPKEGRTERCLNCNQEAHPGKTCTEAWASRGELQQEISESTPEMLEVIRIDTDGRIFWRGREVKGDEEFREAMINLKERLESIQS